MNVIQFQRLQDAVQWAADVHDTPPKEGVTWEQGTWFNGALDGIAPGLGGGEEFHYVDVVCDSACCIAGNVVLNEGDKFVVPSYAIGAFQKQGEEISAEYCLSKDGEYDTIGNRARELLGIESRESNMLFSGESDIDMVIEIASDIARDYGHDLNIIRNRKPVTV